MIKVYSRRQLMAFKPYDAEIEYLESTGVEYIDTGVYCTDAGFMADICITRFPNNPAFLTFIQVSSNNWGTIVGVKSEFRRIAIGNGSWRFTSLSATLYKDYHVEYNFLGSKNTIINDDTYSVPTYIMSSNITIKLFAGIINNNIESQYNHIGRLYNCKISKGTQIIFDAIPVRVGNVGYLFDRVSGQLFGNSGTGSFVLGPDKH